MSFPTIHASWLGAMSYASPAPISVPIPPVSTTCMRPDSRTVRVPPSEESERPVRSRGPHRRLLRVDGRGAFQAPKRRQRDALLIGQRDRRADLTPRQAPSSSTTILRTCLWRRARSPGRASSRPSPAYASRQTTL